MWCDPHIHITQSVDHFTVFCVVEEMRDREKTETRILTAGAECWTFFYKKYVHIDTHDIPAYTRFLGSRGHEAGVRPTVPVRTNQSIQLRAGIYS